MENLSKEKECKKLLANSLKDKNQNILKSKPTNADATTNTEGSLPFSHEKVVNLSPRNTSSIVTHTMGIPFSKLNLSISCPTPSLACNTPALNNIIKCPHSPQCTLRDPNPPPPFAPITFEQYYHPEKPPKQISLLPSTRLSFSEFCELDRKGGHQCEECEPGMLFYNYTERVEYVNPGPCGGTMAQYLRACPNSPRTTISVSAFEIETRLKKIKTLSFRCEICDKAFEKKGAFSFHMNRIHRRK